MFGFQAQNSSDSVILSDQHPTLVYSERGQIVVENTSVVDRPAIGSRSFSSPIQQVSPPRIFIRFNSGRHNSCNIYLTMNGSANNWTGFTIRAAAIGGGTLPRHVLDYVVCKFTTPSEPVNSFGMVIYNSNGIPTYKSEDRPVRFSKFTKSWQKTSGSTSFFQTLVPIGISIQTDDFIDVGSMNRGNAHMALTGLQFSSVQILSGGVRVLQLVSQVNAELGSGGAQQVGSSFFCLPICKFPVSEYPA